MAKKIMKPKKVKKIVMNQNSKIEKKQYTPEERLEKLRQDRITIAQRYEEMRLYDEAIIYYKKLGMTEDVERVMNIKMDIYISKAKEFEKNGNYEDAIRLYDNLKMKEEVERLKHLIDDYEPKPTAAVSTQNDVTNTARLEKPMDKPAEQPKSAIKKSNLEYTEPTQTQVLDFRTPPDKLAEVHETEPEEQKLVIKNENTEEQNKIFKICPYCGQELNLPKKPNFCPYCKERFI